MSEDAHAIEIRQASLSDLGAIQEFLRPFMEAKHILPRTDEDLGTLLHNGFVAERNESVVGFAAIEVYSKKLAEIQALAVDSKVQGQGVGTKLVEQCVARAKAGGVLELMAITVSDDLFRKVGFDYSLPNQKRALFMQIREDGDE